MMLEHEPQANVSTAFSSSPKLSRVFLNSIETRRICFLFLLENTATKKKENNLLKTITRSYRERLEEYSIENTDTGRPLYVFVANNCLHVTNRIYEGYE